ncbi:hypothetical protein RZZ46_15430 [Citrobacter amalonaticus]|uniref:hypothetical protein n=1 Tax=Citrobacter amalonaticus TaxID=35703 RepID=UPI0028D9D462|nr:hypothetical protein [Citrobacter amalonaticus]MEB0586111.1 hypothetical protein [Citrobacter amalonaticus]HDZ8013787.1 hypothetical protein [Citrobacter amalonaticus]
MAGLTKEQRAQRAAEKLATELSAKNNSEEQGAQLVAMFTDFPAFPGAPTTADVHPDEVENWKAAGWRIEE